MCRGIALSCVLVCVFAGLVSSEDRRQIDPSLSYMSEEQTIDKAPYTLQLRNSSGHIVCAGTLISSRHVLTAAHCFDKYKPSDITVVAAATTKTEAGVHRGIEKLFKHDTYNPTTFHNDVAVIKLDSPLETSRNIAVIQMCSTPWTRLPDFNDYSLSGWLATDQEKFHITRIPIIAKEDCEMVYKEVGIATDLTSSMVCNEPDYTFACTHVPGSPAEIYGDVCAFAVGGPGCTDGRFSGIYININEVRGFIDRSVKV